MKVCLVSFRPLWIPKGFERAFSFEKQRCRSWLELRRWLQLSLIAAPILLQVLVFFVYRVRFFAGDRD